MKLKTKQGGSYFESTSLGLSEANVEVCDSILFLSATQNKQKKLGNFHVLSKNNDVVF